MRTALPAFFVFAICLSACSSNQYATPRALYARGSTDLTCSTSELHVSSLDARTRLVRGCGRQATYVEECDTCGARLNRYACNCTWRLDSALH